jgi:hypothetical protein
MKAKQEINRQFPNCFKCGRVLGQCDCAAARNAMEALADFMALREQLGELESHDSDCRCGDFYTCDLCREHRDMTHQLRGLLERWAENWALRLSVAEPKLLELEHEWDGDKYVRCVPVSDLLRGGSRSGKRFVKPFCL